MYLLDTVVLSELRKRRRHPGVVRWLSDKPAEALFLSAVTIGEIARGIARQRDRDPAFAEALDSWLDRTITMHGDRILPVDTAVARRWGSLSAAMPPNALDYFHYFPLARPANG